MRLEANALALKKDVALRYAWAHLGQPYRWGGDDPIHGYDCSGLVVEILTAVGVFPHKYDNTAGGILAELKGMGHPELAQPQAGAIVFYFDKTGFCCHVEIALDALHTLGASGGGSATEDLEAAAKQNAFVKIRPWTYRGQAYKIIDPFAGGTTMKRAKLKATAGDLVAIIAAVLGFLPGLLKKKPYTLWLWDGKAWIDEGTFSKRQCEKMKLELIACGLEAGNLWIFRKGVKPPAGGPTEVPAKGGGK